MNPTFSTPPPPPPLPIYHASAYTCTHLPCLRLHLHPSTIPPSTLASFSTATSPPSAPSVFSTPTSTCTPASIYAPSLPTIPPLRWIHRVHAERDQRSLPRVVRRLRVSHSPSSRLRR